MMEWQKALVGAGAGLALYLLWQLVDEIRSANAKLQRIIELLVDNGFTLK